MLTWLIIILAVVVVIGPVMYLLPNAKDKRLTELRLAARRLGLTVQITSVPKLDPTADERVSAGGKMREPKISCSAYQLSLGQNNLRQGHALLLKLPSRVTVPVKEVAPGWALGDVSADFWQRYNAGGAGVAIIEKAAAMLPEDCLGIAIDNRFVACYWREKASADEGIVEGLKCALEVLRDDFSSRFNKPTETRPEQGS